MRDIPEINVGEAEDSSGMFLLLAFAFFHAAIWFGAGYAVAVYL